MTFCKMMIDETFFFLQSIFIQVCFDSMYFYGCIEKSNVFKKRDYDYILYTSKEIDQFVIKDKIKIGCYKLKFISGGKKLSFSFFS